MSSNNNVVVTLSARDEASRVIDRLRGSLTAASAAGNVLANVITGTVSRAFEGLTNSITKAADAELQTVMAAGAYSRLVGTNFSEATEAVDKLSKSLAIQAASLPGTTDDYIQIAKGIQDDLIPAFKELNGGVFKADDFQSEATKVVSQLGVLQTASGASVENVNKAMSKLLSGNFTLGEFGSFDWTQDTKLYSAIEKRLTAMGKEGKDLKGMAQSEILSILGDSLDELVTPDIVNAASNSLAGKWEGFMSSIFDPNTGVFGLFRDLDENIAGNQNSYNSIKRILDKLIGKDGIFSTIGNILNKVGLGGDAGKLLSSGLGKLGLFLDRFNKFLKGLDTNNLMGDIGTKVGEFINKIIDPAKAAGFASQISIILGNLTLGFLKALGNTLITLDTTSVAMLSAGILTSVFVIPWITTFASSMLTTTLAAATGPIGLLAIAAGLVIVNLTRVIRENWDSILVELGVAFKTFSTVLINTTGGIFDIILGIITGDWNKIGEGFRSIGDSAMKVVNGIQNFVNAVLGKLPGAEQAALDDANRIAEENFQRANANKMNTSGSLRVGAAASGMNYQSLLNAARSEANKAPSGSSLVMANSSEAILNKAQQVELMSNMGKGSGGLSIGNITIHTQATDAATIAKDIMTQITYEFNKFSQGYIAAPVT